MWLESENCWASLSFPLLSSQCFQADVTHTFIIITSEPFVHAQHHLAYYRDSGECARVVKTQASGEDRLVMITNH